MKIEIRREKTIFQLEEEDYPGQNNEIRRQDIIDLCMDAVHHIINEATDGSVEETDFLFSAVALKLHESVHARIAAMLLRHELKERHAKRT